MDFPETEKYLLSLGNEVETMKLGLDNIRKLLAALGDPQKNYLKVQVAGTNGKGSVCAFLDSITGEAGIARGVFTSPHLVSMTERVRINGNDVSEEEFAGFATVVRETAERAAASGELEYIPTFFEQVTVIALLAFAAANIELAVLETGLGGRLDATTASDAEIAAITRIDLDHQEYLGETLAAIAAEKAAIIGGRTEAVVVGAQPAEAMRMIVAACESYQLEPVIAANVDIGQTRLGLRGQHQMENAQVAVALAKLLRARFLIADDAITAGLEKARHPGRLEVQGRYLFDGAHNIGGAKALRDFIDDFVDRPIILIYGAMKGKGVRGFAKLVFPKADKIILTRVDSPRSATAEEIAGQLPAGDYDIRLTQHVSQALQTADKITPTDAIILVTGSLYLVGEVKKLLRSEI